MPIKPKPIRPTRRNRPRGKPVRPAVRGRKSTVGAGHTQALSRGLALLDALAATAGGATLTVVAEQVSLPTPTAHRLLATLEQDRYVQQTAAGAWRVGVRAFRVGSAFLAHRNLVAVARPLLERLMETCGETTTLAVFGDGTAVLVDVAPCAALIRMSPQSGAQVPLHASAAGKAILARLPAGTTAGGGTELRAYTANTLTDPARLALEIGLTQQRGYALDDEEHADGLRGVGAPILDENGDVWAAVALGGPVSRVTPERLEELGRLVLDAAHDITFALGGRWPPPA